jgi:hypothetical protein
LKNTAYWHVYLTENQSTWAAIVMEQLGLAMRSGLLDKLDALKITAIYRANDVQSFSSTVHNTFPAAEITWVENPYYNDGLMLSDFNGLKVTENITTSKIYKDCLDTEQNVLYFHTKGITADLRFLRINEEQYKKYYYWRQFLNWGVLRQWQCCVAGLKDADVVGPNYRLTPYPHFSGAFWWSKSDHIRSLPDPAKDDWWQAMQAESQDNWFRFASKKHKDEFWITSKRDTEVIDLAPGLHNPADRFLDPKEYWSKGC